MGSQGRVFRRMGEKVRYKARFLALTCLLQALLLIMALLMPYLGYCVEINLSAIKQIESSGNPFAYNERSGAIGLYQITPICLKEWNTFAKGGCQYTIFDLADPAVNSKIAHWYLNNRIPQMLEYYRKPVTIRNILISYNAGISYVVENKKLPRETRNYLKKYNRLTIE